MLDYVIIGQYLPGNTFLHRMDPRVKLITVLFNLVVIFLIHQFYALIALLLGYVFLAWLARIPWRMMLRSLVPLIFILVFTLGLHLFFTPGTPIWSWGFLAITREGVVQGLVVGGRLVLLILVTSLLTLTTSPSELTAALESLLGPFQSWGLPVHEVALMMSLAVRFMPTLVEEGDRIIKAQKSRGAEFHSGNLWQRASGLVPIMVPLLVSTLRRAEDLATAMEIRGYRGHQGRTRYRQLTLKALDYQAMAVAGLALGLVLYLGR
jgi:energy-coupling factor transport system permease protein